MKSLTIAWKDLKQAFRSAFALMFMFVVPMLVTGMFYLMFGSQSAPAEEAFQLPATRLVVANLDLGDEALASGLASSGAGSSIRSLGDAVLRGLQEPALKDILVVQQAGSESEARALVDQQAADAALIIPADFSARYAAGESAAEAAFYAGANETFGVEIARGIIEQVLDSFAGVRIAVDVAGSRLASGGLAHEQAAAQAAAQYSQHVAQGQNLANLITLRAPAKAGAAEQSQPGTVASILGPIMSGMMIFFAFFTGGSTAQSILQEEERGTLARLFTTPTRTSVILQGKFIAVGLTVLVQVTLLLIAARLVFGIEWGTLPMVALAAVGIITCAATFGIFVTSLMKSTRQGGAVYGGLMTVTGMLGMMTIFAGQGGTVEIISLLTPQGWAVRGLSLAMNGSGLPEAAVNTLVMLVISAVFMGVGVWKFSRRFA